VTAWGGTSGWVRVQSCFVRTRKRGSLLLRASPASNLQRLYAYSAEGRSQVSACWLLIVVAVQDEERRRIALQEFRSVSNALHPPMLDGME
jgi:hypothetical protein